MKTIKSMSTGLLAVAITAIIGTAPLYAQSTSDGSTNSETTTTTEETTTRATITAARCTIAEAKIDTRITRITAAIEKSNTTYDSIVEKATRFISVAETKGYTETAALQAALDTATTDIDTLKSASSDYLASLEATKEFACGESEGEFLNALASSRASLTEVRAALATAKADTINTLIPAMKDLLTWLQENTSQE